MALYFMAESFLTVISHFIAVLATDAPPRVDLELESEKDDDDDSDSECSSSAIQKNDNNISQRESNAGLVKEMSKEEIATSASQNDLPTIQIQFALGKMDDNPMMKILAGNNSDDDDSEENSSVASCLPGEDPPKTRAVERLLASSSGDQQQKEDTSQSSPKKKSLITEIS